ncbi:ArdC family protein [Kordiimonas pumila]|nr:zincin-like metallopeptidase domain-containing protein [Kordiimonas pumila]
MKSQEIYTSVTNRIIEELEAGTPPWVKPWQGGNADKHVFPHNAVTGRPYSGINVLLLWVRASERNYIRSGWLTFKQAHALGAYVRKGEKAVRIVYVKEIKVTDDEDAEKVIPVIRSYAVFNLCQLEKLPDAYTTPDEPLPDHECMQDIEGFIAATDIDVAHGSDSAAYNPRHDAVVMPLPSQFESPDHYYATLFHEYGHATGHTKRLGRDLTGRFGTQSYAAEELIAELTSAYLCAFFGIEGQLRHASYIEHWLALLRSDNRAVFTAAGKAQEAMTFLLTGAGVPT